MDAKEQLPALMTYARPMPFDPPPWKRNLFSWDLEQVAVRHVAFPFVDFFSMSHLDAALPKKIATWDNVSFMSLC